MDLVATFGKVKQTTGQQVLGLLSLAFVGAFVWWWYQAWASLMHPPTVASAAGVFTVSLAVVYGVALPLLWSMLLPNSPTGHYLQQQTWAQPGQIAVMIAAVVLSVFGGEAMYTWLYINLAVSSPEVLGTWVFWAMLLGAYIGAVFVPSMQLAYQTPAQQMLIIQQAHEIKKLRKLHEGEIAVIEARMIRAALLAGMRWADMLPADREEVYATMKGLFMGIADAQRRIARVQGVPADVQRALGIPDDPQIVQQMEYVQSFLEGPANHIEQAYDYVEYRDMPAPSHADPRLQSSIPRETSREAVYAPDSGHVNARLEPRISRESPASVRRQTTPDDAAYVLAARNAFGVRPWTLKQLAACLEIGDTSAGQLRDTWLADGLCRQVNLGRWSFTINESEAA